MKSLLGRKLSLILATVLCVGGITGCSNTGDGNVEDLSNNVEPTSSVSSEVVITEAVEEPVDYKDVEFRIAWWGSDARHTATTSLIETFEKDFLNLKIDVEYAGFGDYFKKLTTQATGGELPDIMQTDVSKLKEYTDNGLLLALDEYVESGALDFSNVSAETMDAGRVNGELFAVVTGINAPAYFYNPEVLKEAGVTISQTPTLDEYIDVCKKVYDATGVMTLPIDNMRVFSRIVGGDHYNEDGTLGFTEEMLVAYWEYLADGYEYGYFAGPDVVIENIQSALANKTIWGYCDYTNKLESFESESGLSLDMFGVPSTDANEAPSFTKPNTLWTVSSTCENPEIAVAFLNYFINNSTTYDLCGMDRGVPVSTAIRTYMEAGLTPSQKEVNEFLDVLDDGHNSAIYLLDPSGASEVTSVIKEYSERIMYSDLKREDFAAAAKEAFDKMNDCLNVTE